MKAITAPFPLILAFTGRIADLLTAGLRRDARPRRGVGQVALIGAGPGSAELITLRGLDRLKAAEVVFYDRLADPALLAHARPDARLVDVGKAPGHHPVPQDQINALIVEAALAGKRVARLKCGDPGVFGRGAEEAEACHAAGIPCEIVPGVTAASAAAAAAGGFLTERGKTERVILVTGHGSAGPKAEWTGLAAPGTTLVIYMGLSNIASIAAGLVADGWPREALVEIVSNAQTPRQRVLSADLAAIAAGGLSKAPAGPATVLVRWPVSVGAPARTVAASLA